MLEDCWVSWVVWVPALIGITWLFIHDIWISMKSRKQRERIRQLETMLRSQAENEAELTMPQGPQRRGIQ